MSDSIKPSQPNNPLHGVKLVDIVEYLVNEYGWKELGDRIPIRCFQFDASVKSSLRFLRGMPWAREKVEHLYLWTINHKAKVQLTNEADPNKTS
jgi:uncharacterized protein (DUF2132 family)